MLAEAVVLIQAVEGKGGTDEKTARLGNHLGLSSLETPSSDYGKMSLTKI